MPQPPTTTRIETVPAATGAETAITARLRQHAEAARGAYAGNTERALRADVAIFTGWCAGEGRQVLPASAETVATFIDAMAASKAPATVRRYVSSVATFHRAAGVANPCAAQAVKLALKRMHRERGVAQAQAPPLNDVLVARMLAAAGTTLRDRRNKALLTVAYTTRAVPYAPSDGSGVGDQQVAGAVMGEMEHTAAQARGVEQQRRRACAARDLQQPGRGRVSHRRPRRGDVLQIDRAAGTEALDQRPFIGRRADPAAELRRVQNVQRGAA